jgi:hypothetical protein
MGVQIAAASVVGRQVEDDVGTPGGTVGDTRVTQIGLDELDASCLDMPSNMFQPAAAQIVDDAHVCISVDERIHQMGADKRRAPSHQNPRSTPRHALSFD